MNYTQLSFKERVVIETFLAKGESVANIARFLNRKYDTVSNEIKRNSSKLNSKGKTIYKAKEAQRKYLQRRKNSKRSCRIIENNKDLEKLIINKITKKQWSPEQIAYRNNNIISFKSIYRYIYRLKNKELKTKLIKNLRRKGKKYPKNKKKHSYELKIAPKTMIDERPEVIEKRERLGDFEADTLLLSRKKRVITLVDRKSRYTAVALVYDATAYSCYRAIVKICSKKIIKEKIKSITFDNGPEFSYHDLVKLDTGANTYFAYPYHPWERGTNENTNALLRQYIPKKQKHDNIKEEDVLAYAEKLNHRPRKCLNWLTPYEVFVLGKDPGKDGYPHFR